MFDNYYIAHINYDGKEQTCCSHCINTAKIASENLNNVGLSNTAYLAGLLHDMGKYTDGFMNYIRKSASGEKTVRGSVIHSFAGVSYLLNRYHFPDDDIDNTNYINKITSEVLSVAIGSHHGLFDVFDYDGNSGFQKKLIAQPDYDQKSADGFFDSGFGRYKIDDLFQKSCSEIAKIAEIISSISNSNDNVYFYFGMICRLISSAVMDGDRKDTSLFMNGEIVPEIVANNIFWNKQIDSFDTSLKMFKYDTIIQNARRELSDLCYEFASEKPGIYRLNIPTGGGKTLSGLRYALRHSELYGKKRIIYVAPLISILEQNASEIKRVLLPDSVLEHHSDVIIECDDEEQDKSKIRNYLEETWSSPVIATTMVQLLNTLFSSKTTSVRRMQALCNSVIIIDEVQSIPSKMLNLFNLVMNFISTFCNTTVILCSATQPCLESLPQCMNINGSIISKDKYNHYSKIFKRNDITDKGSFRLNEIPQLVFHTIESVDSLLVVCNTKSEAALLYNIVSQHYDCCYHISAGMCMYHRKYTLKKITESLQRKEKTICISTQVIEAGVDISFACVIRLSAGLDNIVQSAGRCNRNGEFDMNSPVYIVDCADENLVRLQDIALAKRATNELLVSFKKAPEKYDCDLSSDKSVEYYYKALFKQYSQNHFDYPLNDMPSIMSMLSANNEFVNNDLLSKFFLRQAFKTAGQMFDVFDSHSYTVIVKYENSDEIIEMIIDCYNNHRLDKMKKYLNMAKQFTVSVYDYQMNNLKKSGGIVEECDGLIYVLNKEYYDNATGIITKIKEESPCSTLIL